MLLKEKGGEGALEEERVRRHVVRGKVTETKNAILGRVARGGEGLSALRKIRFQQMDGWTLVAGRGERPTQKLAGHYQTSRDVKEETMVYEENERMEE